MTRQLRIPSAAEALPGRAEAMPVPERHFVLNTPLQGPFPGKREIQFGMGCFWGAEKQFWPLPVKAFQTALSASELDTITTEIKPAGPFYYAEEYHQQYLAKNPDGYCGLGGTGVACPIGVGVKARQSAGCSR